MSDQNINETQPMVVEPKKKTAVWKWILLGLGIIILLTAAGGSIGYASGLAFRQKTAQTQAALAASTQYQLALSDLSSGNLSRAKDRLVYVIQLDPGYAGAKEKLAEVMIQLASTATPTPAPTATVVPTLDTSGEEALLAQAKQLLAGNDYTGTLSALDNLRKQNPTFKTAEVDGLYYRALRYRGVQKISNDGFLEGGIYDITLASKFGPIDGQANGVMQTAKLYITAASFWEVNWEQSLFYFSQLYTSDPYVHDINNWTAVDRFRTASIGYGDEFMTKNNYCSAQEQYQNAINIKDDQKTADKLLVATNKCAESQGITTETPTPETTATTPAPEGTVVTTEAPVVVTTEPPADTPVPPTAEAPVKTP
jgi:tetratricopeptide (TPR) repeat protein